MFFVSELPEDIKAQKFGKDGELIGVVIIPKGTKISIQDTGEKAQVLAPTEYAGYIFASGNINKDLYKQ